MDRQVVFNYKYNTWSTRYGDKVSAFGIVGKRARTIDELVGHIDDQTGVIDDLEESTENGIVVWGTPATVSPGLTREEIASDDAVLVIYNTDIAMETGDLLYGSAQTVKEVSSMTINASGSVFNGVAVKISAREHLDDEITWTTVGVWTKTLPEKMLTFAPVVGKILRYRFEPVVPVRDFVFRGYEDNVLSANASR
jgi:hypothetical protein